MILKNNYFTNIAKILTKMLILSAFPLFYFISCDFDSDNNLLTFYYQAEDSQKQKAIDTLLNGFEKATGINVAVKTCFLDELTKILIQNDFHGDVIEIDNSIISEFIQTGSLFIFDSLPVTVILNKKNSPINNLIPWLKDNYYLFYNKKLISNKHNIILPITNIQALTQNSQKVDSANIKGFGMVVNDPNNTFNNFLCFLNWNGGTIPISEDSISINTRIVVNTFEQYQSLSKYSFLGTQKEIENAFLNGKIGFCIGSSHLKKQISKNMNDYNYQIVEGSLNKVKSYLAISKHSKKIENSIKLINFLTADSTMNKLKKIGLTVGDIDKAIAENINQTTHLFDKQIVNEIEKTISTIVFVQDSIYNIIEKTQRKINRLVKIKKHKQYRK